MYVYINKTVRNSLKKYWNLLSKYIFVTPLKVYCVFDVLSFVRYLIKFNYNNLRCGHLAVFCISVSLFEV